MKNGSTVAAFESAFAQRVGAKHAIGMVNGTQTLEVALRAMGVQRGQRVATTPLTMAATSIATLNVGAVPVYCDVDYNTWLIDPYQFDKHPGVRAAIPVSLYGLHCPFAIGARMIDDAAQTLRRHGGSAFTSYSLQRSKILNTGEGGVLVTDDDRLAQEAREIASLGYKLNAGESRIDKNAIKSPSYARHYRLHSQNARMNDITASEGLRQLERADELLRNRFLCACLYADAIAGVPWITPQRTPENWKHDHWSSAFVVDTPERWEPLAQAIVRHGGERPYAAWRLTYDEPAFAHLVMKTTHRTIDGPLPIHSSISTRPRSICHVAESIQPRIMAMQNNNLDSASKNANALRLAIKELNG